MTRAAAALTAVGLSLGFAACYFLMVGTAAGQAGDVLAFRVLFGLVPDGWPAVLVSGFARAASIVALAAIAVGLGVAAVGRRSWRALVVASLTVAASVWLGRWLRDEVLERPGFTAEAFPQNSMPSTHAVAAGALVAALLLLWPGRRPWWLPNTAAVVLLLVALGNILSQAHRPSDVAASFLLVGSVGAAAVAVVGHPGSAVSIRPVQTNARAVAFYLPQYFPIPENDEWWGRGFTEWTNVASARRLFPGHQQPTLPSELGFYDLRVPETRAAQAELAKQYGVEAFVYWHYWFGDGDRILDRPFHEVLASGEPDHSFCLAWANQTWTGIWHGAKDRVLKQQRYPGADDERRHFAELLPAFADPRYLTVDGRPVFYVFRPEELPNAADFVERWQAMAIEAGLSGLYLVAEMSDLLGRGPAYTASMGDGFDAAVYMRLPAEVTPSSVLRMRLLRKAMRGGPEIYSYSDTVMAQSRRGPHIQPCVYPNWDNTPRSGRSGLTIVGATPEKFRRNVVEAVRTVRDRPAEERLLWIKSWNEWAEGNHLEPDARTGRGWLEALREGLTADE